MEMSKEKTLRTSTYVPQSDESSQRFLRLPPKYIAEEQRGNSHASFQNLLLGCRPVKWASLALNLANALRYSREIGDIGKQIKNGTDTEAKGSSNLQRPNRILYIVQDIVDI